MSSLKTHHGSQQSLHWNSRPVFHLNSDEFRHFRVELVAKKHLILLYFHSNYGGSQTYSLSVFIYSFTEMSTNNEKNSAVISILLNSL